MSNFTYQGDPKTIDVKEIMRRIEQEVHGEEFDQTLLQNSERLFERSAAGAGLMPAPYVDVEIQLNTLPIENTRDLIEPPITGNFLSRFFKKIARKFTRDFVMGISAQQVQYNLASSELIKEFSIQTIDNFQNFNKEFHYQNLMFSSVSSTNESLQEQLYLQQDQMAELINKINVLEEQLSTLENKG